MSAKLMSFMGKRADIRVDTLLRRISRILCSSAKPCRGGLREVRYLSGCQSSLCWAADFISGVGHVAPKERVR